MQVGIISTRVYESRTLGGGGVSNMLYVRCQPLGSNMISGVLHVRLMSYIYSVHTHVCKTAAACAWPYYHSVHGVCGTFPEVNAFVIMC